MEIFVGRLQDEVGILLHEVGQVEHVLVEFQDRELLVFVQLLAGSVAQEEGGAPFDFDEGGAAGKNVGREFRIGHVRDEHAAQLAIDQVTGIEGEAFPVRCELAGADEGCGKVGAGLRDGLAHGPLSRGLDPEIDRQVRDGAEGGEAHDRRGDLPRRHAGGLGDHDLAVLVDAVERPDTRHEQGERREQGDNLRRAQHDDIEVSQGRLAVFEDEIGAREALREQGEHGQTPDDDDDRAQDFIEKIGLDFAHTLKWTINSGILPDMGHAFFLANELRCARRRLVSVTNGEYTHEDFFRRRRQGRYRRIHH